MKLADISFGTIAHDKITGLKGTVTSKVERMSGEHSIGVEGIDTTGKPYQEWIELPRVELDKPA